MKRITKLMLAACVATALLPMTSMAQTSVNEGYWVNSSGSVWKDSSGECWRAGYWTPSMANAECDSALIKTAALPMVIAEAPAAAAPLPELPPVPAAVAMPQKMTFSADALFDFDKSVLKPAGKLMLDGLISGLDNVQYDVIELTGHTDRLGSAAYNQKLSERRAQSVKAYLLSKGGVPKDHVTAQGRGETQPVTKASDCQGPKSAKLIACLQPDRRVDVETKGLKN